MADNVLWMTKADAQEILTKLREIEAIMNDILEHSARKAYNEYCNEKNHQKI